jgi:hypothetical protein
MGRNFQRSRIYKWESEWSDWNRQTLSLKKCRKLIHAACKLFDLKMLPVVKRSEEQFSYHRKAGEIGLLKQHQTPAVALHEAAHYIVFQTDGRHGHDELFMGVYLVLLAHFRIAPRDALEHSLRKRKIKWIQVKKKGRS